MVGSKPEHLLRQYNEGRITRSELLYRLVQAATVDPPESFAPALPSDALQELREQSATPPQSAEGSPRFFYVGSWVGSHDYAAEVREEQRIWYEGVGQWHRYFHGGPAEPPKGLGD